MTATAPTSINSENGDAMTDLSLTEDDKLIVAHVMGMNIFVPPPLMTQSGALGETYSDWLELAGPEKLTFFLTESMSKHRKVNKKTLAMLPSWLEEGAPRDYVTIDLVSSDASDSEGETRIFIHSVETKFDPETTDMADSRSAILRLTLPLGQIPYNEFRDHFLSSLSRFPFVSASAGHALVASQYYEADAQTHAWETSMHHPGADIYVDIIDRFTTGLNGLKTVNWLTAISNEMVGTLGGKAQLSTSLPQDVQIHEVEGGLVFQAGPEPRLGNTNEGDTLPLYRAVDALLKPLRDVRAREAKSFVVDGDTGTASPRWYARFEPSD